MFYYLLLLHVTIYLYRVWSVIIKSENRGKYHGRVGNTVYVYRYILSLVYLIFICVNEKLLVTVLEMNENARVSLDPARSHVDLNVL